MTIKVYDGSTWQPQKSLKINDGATWYSAKKGWVSQNGINWSQFYPEYPQNTVAPSISGTATQGNTLTCANGTWTSTDAYVPASYAYQWTRSGVDISGATASTYSTVVGDVGNAIGCKVTATNNRGTTTVSSSNTITVTSALPSPPSNLSLSDVTLSAGLPTSLSLSITGDTTATLTWGAPTSGTWQTYSVSSSQGTTTWGGDINVRSASITGGTAGTSITSYVSGVNNYGRWTASWSAGANATSYDVYQNGAFLGNTSSTSYTYQSTFTGSRTIMVRSRNSAGAETTGVSGNVTCNQQTNTNSTSSTFSKTPTVSASNSNVTSNSATISWTSTNQNSYSVGGLPSSYSGNPDTTTRSISATGLSGSTTYTATVTVTSTTGHTASSSTTFTTSATPITPTISMSSNSGVTSSSGTINWTSTNQNSWSSTGTFSGSGNPDTSTRSVSKSGLTASTTYTGTVTVTSTTGHTASANYSLTTSAAASSIGNTSIVVAQADSCSPASTYIEFTPASGATCYDFFWNNSNSAPSAGSTPDYSCQAGTVTGSNRYVSLSMGGSLWWWVRGKNGSNTGNWSSGVQATLFAGC